MKNYFPILSRSLLILSIALSLATNFAVANEDSEKPASGSQDNKREQLEKIRLALIEFAGQDGKNRLTAQQIVTQNRLWGKQEQEPIERLQSIQTKDKHSYQSFADFAADLEAVAASSLSDEAKAELFIGAIPEALKFASGSNNLLRSSRRGVGFMSRSAGVMGTLLRNAETFQDAFLDKYRELISKREIGEPDLIIISKNEGLAVELIDKMIRYAKHEDTPEFEQLVTLHLLAWTHGRLREQIEAADRPSTEISAPAKKYLSFAQRIISRSDKNGDGKLSASEWSEMLMSPAKADTNADGIVTVEEYAVFLQNNDLK
ncbi:MAG: hypothetical protein AAF958_09955 [Planctomycetota bacterium]